jgi:flagellar biosynthesis/type III secretory pathway M-ring protein FliF/YscJ
MSNRPCKSDKSSPQPKQPKPELRPTKAELEVLLKKAAELTAQKPEKAAIILTAWLTQGPTRRYTPKK